MKDFEIRTLAEGEKITEPGFYNIPLDVHHNQPCDGVSVTSGVLRMMELRSPAEVWAYHALNPDRYEKDDTDALRLGRAMAGYIEAGEEGLAQYFRTLPEGAPRRPTPAQIKAVDEGRGSDTAIKSVEFWKEQDADPRDLIKHDEWKLIEEMGRVLASDPAAQVVMDGVPECTMAWKDEETGLWLLARPDTVNFDGVSTDYKKINTAGRAFNYRLIDNRITEHGYYMQMAFAAEVFEKLTGIWPDCGIIAQWDKPPHHVILRGISEGYLRIGQFRNRRAIRTFKECMDNNHWPGPGDDVGEYRMPEWMEDKLVEQMENA